MIDFTYTIIRSARRTKSICVLRDGSIQVKVPYTTSEKQIEIFVESKADWIKKHIANVNRKNQLFDSVLSGKSILVEGKEVALVYGEKNLIESDRVVIRTSSALKQLYIRYFYGQFMQLFNDILSSQGFRCSGINFKNYKSRWGCCDRDKKITFNYKLFMLPQALWRLVIAHELCHTVYMNHSKKFYALLNSVLPDYKALERQLKDFSPICALYCK